MTINGVSQEVETTRELIDKSHVLRLAMFADMVDRFIDIYLKGKASWLKIFSLTILIGDGGAATPTELGKTMRRPKDSMTKLINTLVREGLVKRYHRGKDRRSVQIVVTQEGLNYIAQTLNLVSNDDKMILTSIKPEDLETYSNTLKQLGTWFSERIASIIENKS